MSVTNSSAVPVTIGDGLSVTKVLTVTVGVLCLNDQFKRGVIVGYRLFVTSSHGNDIAGPITQR